MRKVILAILASIIISFPVSINPFSQASGFCGERINDVLKSNPEIDWIEYVCIEKQWFEVTHYADGSIGVVPISAPPNDR